MNLLPNKDYNLHLSLWSSPSPPPKITTIWNLMLNIDIFLSCNLEGLIYICYINKINP